MLKTKYELLSAVTKFKPQQITGEGNPSAGKLVELTKKYIELLNIYRPEANQEVKTPT